eukprot:TRINITY_DN44158_c0_g1_i1.p1 TRINITY_DN44158_c0_g1~~TRINITY_DN44158_c0_g1_i1.p1  ORF type:complete len:492 (-),score=158.99 TRINITY_DN44158_c0_g1_i1:233-1678(-)
MLRQSIRLLANKSYDVVVVGGGPGGYVAAIKAAQLGLKTACVEKRKTLGGTCLNVGCIPSKALLNATHHFEFAQKHAADFGIEHTAPEMNYGKMHKQRLKAINDLCGGIGYLFKKNKIDWIGGSAEFESPNVVKVGADTITATKGTIIATGSEPTPVPFAPYDEKIVVSSTGALEFPKPPKHLIIIGGGVIGLELGSVWGRLGTKVTVVEYAPTICPTLDAELVKEFRKVLGKQGFTFHESSKVTSVNVTSSDPDAPAVEVTYEPSKGGKATKLEGDAVLVSVGRRAFVEGLGLEKIGVELNPRSKAVKINPSTYETNVKGVYAIGDVADHGPMLAHKASEEGVAVAEILAGKPGHVNYEAIPGVVYTAPEVAWVGKTEEEARAAGHDVKIGKFAYTANSRAKTNLDTTGFVKVITDKKTDRILGAHIIGSNAGEAIAEFVLGVEYGASAEDIGRTCHAHPTMSEAVGEACKAAYDLPIHS